MNPAKPKTLKKSNRKTILNLLRSSEETTVNEIHKQAGLSKTTVMKIINYYLQSGFILERGKGDSTDEGGKKPLLYRFNEKQGYALGVHIFPGEIYFIVTDLRLTILSGYSIPIDADITGEAMVSHTAEGISRSLQELSMDPEKCVGIAIGAHGITDFDKGIIQLSPHFRSLGENLAFKELLSEKLPDSIPLFIDNQIRFQTFAEQTVGIARDKKNIIVIEGGEGLVAGIIVKNEIKRGVHYIAGEIGHMIINPGDDEECCCGGKGCFEAQVSEQRLLGRAEKMRTDFPDSPLYCDGVLDREGIVGIFRLADAGDRAARNILESVIRWFAIGISNLMLMHDPEIVIFQGTYARAGEYFLETLRREVNRTVLTGLPKSIEIRYSELGKERGALGGAAFAIDRYFAEEELYSEM